MTRSLFYVFLLTAAACSPQERDAIGPPKAGPVRPDSKKELDAVLEARLLERERGREARTELRPNCAAFSTDGKRVAIGFSVANDDSYKGPRLKIWDVKTRKEAGYWRRPPELPDKIFPQLPYDRKYCSVFFVSFLPGGKEVLTIEGDNVCRILKADEGTLLREFSLGNAGRALVTADGKKLMVSVPGGFAILDVETGKKVKEQEVSSKKSTGALFSLDGKRAFFRFDSDANGPDPPTGIYWDVQNGRLIQEMKASPDDPKNAPGRSEITPILFSPDQKTVFASKTNRGEVGLVLCDAENLKELSAITPMVSSKEVRQAYRAIFSPNGDRLVTIDLAVGNQNYSSKIHVFDIPNRKRLLTQTDLMGCSEAERFAYSATDDLLLCINGVKTGLGSRNQFILFDTRKGTAVGALDQNVFYP
jgi:hypothetical protein